MKTMDLQEFRDKGYLQEVNRQSIYGSGKSANKIILVIQFEYNN